MNDPTLYSPCHQKVKGERVEPRKSSSTKWSVFPKELCDIIESVIRQEVSDISDDTKVIVEGRIYAEEILLRIGYLPQEGLRQHNFESAIDYQATKVRTIDKVQVLLEGSLSMMQDFIKADESAEEADVPYLWKEFDVHSEKGVERIALKYSTYNSKLEAEANRLLGEDIEALIYQTEESEIEELLEKYGLGNIFAASRKPTDADTEKPTVH